MQQLNNDKSGCSFHVTNQETVYFDQANCSSCTKPYHGYCSQILLLGCHWAVQTTNGTVNTRAIGSCHR